MVLLLHTFLITVRVLLIFRRRSMAIPVLTFLLRSMVLLFLISHRHIMVLLALITALPTKARLTCSSDDPLFIAPKICVELQLEFRLYCGCSCKLPSLTTRRFSVSEDQLLTQERFRRYIGQLCFGRCRCFVCPRCTLASVESGSCLMIK